MIGVYIKGMELPKDGCHHMICIYADGTVSTGGREYTALPVPPHGRLIDADIPEDDRQVYGFFYDYDLQQLLDSRKTIIPAEGGDAQ